MNDELKSLIEGIPRLDAYKVCLEHLDVVPELIERFSTRLETDEDAESSPRNEGEVLVNGPIVGNAASSFLTEMFGEGLVTSPAQFNSDLKTAKSESPDQVVVRINSPGGSVWGASEIYNRIKGEETPVRIVVDGVSASAATLLHFATDDVLMSPLSQAVIHNPSQLVFARMTAADMRVRAVILDKTAQQAASIYDTRMDYEALGVADASALMSGGETNHGTWLTAQEAVDSKLATGMLESEPEPEASISDSSTCAGVGFGSGADL